MKLGHKIIYIFLPIFILLKINISFSQEKKLNVLLVEIKQNIDPRINRYTKLMLEEVEKKDYDMIIIEMDTYGGALNDADDIRTRILDFDKPIYSWINKDAASAGALISIACDSIYMSSGASIGAATVVTADGSAAPDKMPKKWRKRYASNWELSAARGASVVRYMIDKGIPAPRLLAAGYGAWAPHGLDSVKKANPTWNPLSLTWEEEVKTSTGIVLPTVVSLNASSKLKAKNRRIQITFLNPPHHGDSYKD